MVRYALVAVLLLTTPALAVQPDEILDDPKLEERARELSKEIRCLVCRNESIDDSGADLARDLRILVRERLVEGDTDPEVKQYLVDRFGEYVLLKPTFTAGNLLLWAAGPLVFLAGLAGAVVWLRGRATDVAAAPAAAPLTEAEEAALARLLDQDRKG